jgi:hypothetical protein
MRVRGRHRFVSVSTACEQELAPLDDGLEGSRKPVEIVIARALDEVGDAEGLEGGELIEICRL